MKAKRLLLLLSSLATACNNQPSNPAATATTNPVSCGAGTALQGDTCVATAPASGTGDTTPNAPASLSCGTGTVAQNGACVVDTSGCAAGTLLNAAGACEPTAMVCAAGTTFDTGTKTCIASISSCGPNTHQVGSVCVPSVRVSLAMGVPGVSGPTGPYDWYAVSAADLVAIELGNPVAPHSAIKLGTTGGPLASTALQQVPLSLSLDEAYGFLFVPAGQPADFATPGGLVATVTYSPSLIAGEWPVSSGRVFVPLVGDQVLMYMGNNTVIRLAMPSEAGTASEARFNLAFLLAASPTRMTRVSSSHQHDPANLAPLFMGGSRTPDALFAVGDVLTIESLVGAESGSLQGGIIAPTNAAQGLTPGERYACVVFNELFLGVPFCFDGKAHSAASDVLPPELPDDYKRFELLTSTERFASRLIVNAFSSPIALLETSVSGEPAMVWGQWAVGATGSRVYLSDTRYDYELRGASGPLMNTAHFTLPATSAEASFVVIAPLGSDPSKPTLTLVPERGSVVSTTTYTAVNGTTGPIDFALGDPLVGPAAVLSSGATVRVDIVTDCSSPASHQVYVSGSCFDIDPCPYAGEHVLLSLMPGAKPLVYQHNGSTYTFGTSPSCPF